MREPAIGDWYDEDTCRYCGRRIRMNRGHACPPDPPARKPGWYVQLSGRIDAGPFESQERATSYAEAVGGMLVKLT